MTPHVCPHPVVLQRLYAGPLGAHSAPFAQPLLAQGDASWTAQDTMRLRADLRSGLPPQALTATALHAQRARDLLQDRHQRYRAHRHDRSILRQLLGALRAQGGRPPPVAEPRPSAGDRIGRDLQHDLLHQRGLAPTTGSSSLDRVRRFLHGRCGSQPLRLEALCAHDITDFRLRQTRQSSPTHGKVIATGLRSFVRFVRQAGATTTAVAPAVPPGPHWRLSGLPQLMNAEEVAGLLHSGDRRTPQGHRADALLLLLARLGLRAGAVVALPLDNLAWDAGELLGRGQGARQARLPLPHAGGAAFVASRRAGRPPSRTRQVFLRRRAPHRGCAKSPGSRTIVARALARAGLEPALQGAHLLRHALATPWLHTGAALAEMGEL
jgi:integrase/recombinase XerD